MRYSTLGSTGLKVSRLGLGTTTFMGIFTRRSPDDCVRVLLRGLDAGINLVDTAPSYGEGLAEEMVGRALRGRRDDVVLTTKVGSYVPEAFDFSPRRIRSGLEDSLRRLGTDHVDVLFAHDIEYGHPEQILGEVLPLLAELRDEGKTRAIGVSGLLLEPLGTAVDRAGVDVVQTYCRYGLHDQSLVEPATGWRASGAGTVLGSPVAMGLLTQAGPPAWHPAHPTLKAAAREAAALCAAHGTDLAALAMRYALDCPYLDSVLTGAGDPDHLDRNLLALDTAAEPDLLQAVLRCFSDVAERTWPSGDGAWATAGS
ncbi:aldo/keto reductase [Streptomyces ipomoeae]|uniref:aldo/keto reductase n=1 Tax=Streptomyces ipomoeae TaxID=103232 RepID=UPI00114795DA|nr:aldo/keto reductase [Streptomyces ipomoeae]MDX2938362.1 aldo/keto reductase [Streptomyces ipomoeae]TQE22066.1 aldo/keto reductase [Streptomyces ipomoeae]